MQKKILPLIAAIGGLGITTVTTAGVKYEDGEKFLKIGGRIHLQYHQENPEVGNTEDELFFRRFRLYIEGSLHEDWSGKFQWDMGKSDLAVKDAYMQYKGFDNMEVTLGNANFPFSRELLTSSKKQQLVERSFVGDHNYGTPDRNVGMHLSGKTGDQFSWAFSIAQATVDPDNKKLDFDTPVNNDNESDADDWAEGWMYGGRIDFHPLGFLKMSQGDFDGDQKLTISFAAFAWGNDEDNLGEDAGNNPATKADVDSVTGVEFSAAYRVAGLSVDAEFNSFEADLITAGITSGIYEDSETTLENWSVDGGYMVIDDTVELVAGVESQDADNYAETWDRTSVGVNWFLHKHDIKYQLTYRMNENVNGVDGADEDEIFLQGQYVF